MSAVSNRPRRSSPLNLPSAFELFKPSKDIVLKNIGVFVPLYILPFIFLVNTWLWNISSTHGAQHWKLQFADHNGGWNIPTLPVYTWGLLAGIFSIFVLVSLTVGIIIKIMTQAAELEGAEGKLITFKSIWKTTKELGWRMLGLYIVVGLVVLVGFILLIVPGLFMIRRYILSPYVMLDKKVSIRQAMDRSAALSKTNTGAVWGLMGVMLLIGLVGVIPILGGVASFILGMLYSVAPAIRYQQLKKLAG
jgi:hypothetical protein